MIDMLEHPACGQRAGRDPHPFTAIGCIARLDTATAAFDLGSDGASETIDGLSLAERQRLTGLALG